MSNINWKDKCWVTTVYLVRSDGKVLLTWNKNCQAWIPVGGHVDVGEEPANAVRREVAEETGFDFEFVPAPQMIGTVEVHKPWCVQVEKVPHHDKHINVVFFGKCTRWSEKEANDENEKLRWFSLAELEAEKPKMIPSVYAWSVEAIKMVAKA